MTIIKPARPVRSYVLRQGRMTLAQKQAISDHWSEYGLTAALDKKPFDWQSIFAREAPRVLEIGFGMGESLVNLALNHPEIDFIGIEVHQPGVGACMRSAKAHDLQNLRLLNQDAYQLLTATIPEQSIDKVLLLFPDPWPKTRHNKRRLVQPAFTQLITKVLKTNGIFHCATDWQPYADHMITVLETTPGLVNHFGPEQFSPAPYERTSTKFERRGQKLGHTIFDLVYSKL
jgi:tRNA (guanine-N7-)-methyltransferase